MDNSVSKVLPSSVIVVINEKDLSLKVALITNDGKKKVLSRLFNNMDDLLDERELWLRVRRGEVEVGIRTTRMIDYMMRKVVVIGQN